MIAKTSRYARNMVVPLQDEAGMVRQTILDLTPAVTRYRVVDYIWSQGDRPDLVASRFYGIDTAWWLFADANPEIMDWTNLAVGTKIRIPDASV